MKNLQSLPLAPRLRMHVAAALLLVPLAALVTTPPAAAQHRTPETVAVAQPIDRFVLRTHGGIEPGREVRFRLVGQPGGRAWFRVPGVLGRTSLTEVRAGVYEASYTVRRRDDPRAFSRAVATLQLGQERFAARVQVRGDDNEQQARDERAPVIAALSPAPDERVGRRRSTNISARFSDEGSGVDPASVRMLLNGRDVTSEARTDADEIHFRGFLPRGRHTAELVVKDRAGNTARRSWTFEVAGRG
jgi:hypothetical protein